MLKRSLFILFFTSGLIFGQMAPKIAVEPMTYDMGNIKQGDMVTKVYTVKNEGRAMLNIRNVRASCGCTAAKPAKNDLKPGESTELKVTFNSEGRAGKQDKAVYIETNDPSNSTFQVTFTANVVVRKNTSKTPKLSFTEMSHDFGKLNEGKIAQYTFNFTNTGGTALEIGYVVTTGPGVAAHLSSRKIDPGKKGTLKVELDTSNLQGKLAKNIIISCNDPAQPKHTLIITADVVKRN